jgi:hypothetical protein
MVVSLPIDTTILIMNTINNSISANQFQFLLFAKNNVNNSGHGGTTGISVIITKKVASKIKH